MGVMGNVVRRIVALVPRVNQVTCGEEDSGNRYETEKIEFLPGIQKNEGEHHGRDCPRCTYRIVVIVVPVFYQGP